LGVLATLVLCGVSSSFVTSAQTQNAGTKHAAQTKTATALRKTAITRSVCANCIRAHMEFLASDALQGRGSGTHDELVAATYIAAELREYGIEPAGDDGGYIETVTLLHRDVATAPELTFSASGSSAQEVAWKHGNEFLTLYLTRFTFSGPLQKVSADTSEPKIKSGSIVFVTTSDKQRLQSAVRNAFAQGAAAALIPVSADRREHWHELSAKLPELPVQVDGGPENALGENYNILALSDEAQKVIQALPDGTDLRFDGHAGPPQKSTTWNVVGILRGRDPEQKRNAILLTAHLDHLGIGKAVNGDDIYNGADDDASGTSAVLELARVLGKGQRPRRTVLFALFGSEEAGGLGSTYFREHPPLPLSEIVANLEFEMIGRPDPKLKADTLWLSGWERSNLGPELATHGANLMGDPHPEQNFFRRSDNYVLAKKGVVAQTVSSFGLHQDYHQPSDDLAHIDFKHMEAAIESLIAPVEWLVNSDFVPKWKPGGQP
jgi:aminopeptidase YwaD